MQIFQNKCNLPAIDKGEVLFSKREGNKPDNSGSISDVIIVEPVINALLFINWQS